jgi:microcystin-dependent protein
MLYTPYLSQIALFAFNFAPKGWATCSGQLLPINQNQALFALLGTTYGGNGQTTFALPDLRGRVPMGFGQGTPSPYYLGETGGSETAPLDVTHLPSHVHGIDVSALTAATARCTNTTADQRSPASGVPAIEAAGVTATYSSSATPDANMRTGAMAVTMTPDVAGGGQPHANLQPYLALTYCIALQGIFPSQN